MRCSGKSKQSGERCKKSAVPGFSVCEIHGGKTPTGYGLPQTTIGRYSKHLPTRLAEKYSEAIGDPELLSVREDVALLDSRISDVMASASNQESGELWNNLKEALRDYDKANGKDAEVTRSEAFSKIRWLIREGYAEWQSWKDIRFMLQERMRLVESERKRLVEMQQMLTTEDALLLIGRLGGILKQHITDRDTLAAIAKEIRTLTG